MAYSAHQKDSRQDPNLPIFSTIDSWHHAFIRWKLFASHGIGSRAQSGVPNRKMRGLNFMPILKREKLDQRSLDSNIESKLSNNTYWNIIEIFNELF